MRLDKTMRFPRNMTLGAIQDIHLIYQMGKEVARQCLAIGVHVNFAPVVDVNINPDNPVINDRSFGEDKKRVAECGAAFAQGLTDGGILSCAKHFPGHGDTNIDSHFDLPRIEFTKERLDQIELYPFRHMINEQVPAIMTAHLSIPALDDTPNLPSSLSHAIVTELLRDGLGFEGLTISDSLKMRAITNRFEAGDIELRALQAGNDILLCTVDVPKAIATIEEAILDGRIPEDVLDTSVLKILRAKERYVLQGKDLELEEALSALHNRRAQALKKKLYQRAITLVRNEQALPIDPQQVVAVQIGGAKGEPFSDAFESIYYQPANASKKETMQLLANLEAAQTVVIGIFEMNKFSKNNFGITQGTLELIHRLQKQGKHIILTLFGNPYSLRNFGQEAAIVVAYEDDEDAQQAAIDVITGKLEPTGKLPVTASEQFRAGMGIHL